MNTWLRDQLKLHIAFSDWRILSPIKNPLKPKYKRSINKVVLKSEFYITRYLKKMGKGCLVDEIIAGAFPAYKTIRASKIIKDVEKLEQAGVLRAEGKFGHERYSLTEEIKCHQ